MVCISPRCTYLVWRNVSLDKVYSWPDFARCRHRRQKWPAVSQQCVGTVYLIRSILQVQSAGYLADFRKVSRGVSDHCCVPRWIWPLFFPRCTWPLLFFSAYLTSNVSRGVRYLTPIMFRGVPDLNCFPRRTWPLLFFSVYLTSIVSLYVPRPYYVPRCTWSLLCLSMYLAPNMFHGVPDLYCFPRRTWPLLFFSVYPYLTSIVSNSVPDLYFVLRRTLLGWPDCRQ